MDPERDASPILELSSVVAGYGAIMPSFEGQLKENEIEGLIAFIKSLK